MQNQTTNVTKKCKHCQTDIPKGAKICPNCRKKQGGAGKVFLIVIAAFVMILIIGNMLGGNDDKDSKTANSDNTKTSESNDSKASIALGSEGTSEDLTLKVNEVGDAAEIVENEYLKYTPDSGKYAIINITIKNIGKNAVSMTSGYFKLVTTDGTEYSPTTLFGLDNKYITFESINPGLDLTGNLVFEVPSDLVVADTTLKFSGTGLFTGATTFNLK